MSTIFSPCGKEACFPVDSTNSCLGNNAALALSKGYFAQFKLSKDSRNKTCDAVPLEWLPWLHFKMASLMPTFHTSHKTGAIPRDHTTIYKWLLLTWKQADAPGSRCCWDMGIFLSKEAEWVGITSSVLSGFVVGFIKLHGKSNKIPLRINVVEASEVKSLIQSRTVNPDPQRTKGFPHH